MKFQGFQQHQLGRGKFGDLAIISGHIWARVKRSCRLPVPGVANR